MQYNTSEQSSILYSQNDKDKENFVKLINVMKSSRNGKVVGVFSKDGFPGEFSESWQKTMASHNFENVDIGSSLAYIMAPKEESELLTIKKACLVSVDVFGKYLKEQILEIIDAEKVSCALNILYIYQALSIYFNIFPFHCYCSKYF